MPLGIHQKKKKLTAYNCWRIFEIQVEEILFDPPTTPPRTTPPPPRTLPFTKRSHRKDIDAALPTSTTLHLVVFNRSSWLLQAVLLQLRFLEASRGDRRCSQAMHGVY